MSLKTSLRKLGFDEKEAVVYMALLEMGKTNIVPLARRLILPRNTVVYTLKSLEIKGIIEIEKEGSRRSYVPKNPQVFEEYLLNKKKAVFEQTKELDSILPELNRVFINTSGEPRMKFYRGQKEIRQIYEEMLDVPDEILYMGEYDKIVEVLGLNFLKSWVEQRMGKGIKTRSVRVRTHEIRERLFQMPEETLRKIRYAPDGLVSPGHVSIYGNTVAVITTQKENFGLVVISKEYATIMRSWFEVLWQSSSE